MKGRRRYARISGWGCYVPSKVLTNDELSQMVDTSDEWIRTRTGIAERRVVGAKESTSTMSIRAAQKALDVAGCDPAELDLIIVATATPDYLFPATACLVQDALSAHRAGAFDLGAGCSGFVYALGVATDAISAGTHDKVLVIGAEALTRIVDWTDRSTCVLFGDGAGAVMLEGTDVPSGVLSTVLGADGSGAELLYLPGSGFRDPPGPDGQDGHQPRHVKMNGNEIYRFATRTMVKAAQQAIDKAGMSLADVDLIIPHQANLRIIQAVSKQLKLPDEKVFVNLESYGNTSAASIPIALCEAIDAGRVRTDSTLLLVAFGAGLTWASTIVRWAPTARPEKRPWWQRLVVALRLRFAPVSSGMKRMQRRADAVVQDASDEVEKRVPRRKDE